MIQAEKGESGEVQKWSSWLRMVAVGIEMLGGHERGIKR